MLSLRAFSPRRRPGDRLRTRLGPGYLDLEERRLLAEAASSLRSRYQ
jgi:hypothetical protein